MPRPRARNAVLLISFVFAQRDWIPDGRFRGCSRPNISLILFRGISINGFWLEDSYRIGVEDETLDDRPASFFMMWSTLPRSALRDLT